MFEHGLTKYKYYSVREKINYYTKIMKGKINPSKVSKEYAEKRLIELNAINSRNYNDEPSLIITDDKHFGNGMSKPRLCVVTNEDYKGRLKVYPLNKRKTNVISLPSYPNRQLEQFRLLDKSDVYETKYISNVVELTNLDKEVIKSFINKKQ